MTRPSLDEAGLAAPPRSNGELLFEAPWESRVFGLTLALCEAGAFGWEEFRELLIHEISRYDASHPVGGGADRGSYDYYGHWLAALERLISRKGLCDTEELAERMRAYTARPHGHDHPTRS